MLVPMFAISTTKAYNEIQFELASVILLEVSFCHHTKTLKTTAPETLRESLYIMSSI